MMILGTEGSVGDLVGGFLALIPIALFGVYLWHGLTDQKRRQYAKYETRRARRERVRRLRGTRHEHARTSDKEYLYIVTSTRYGGGYAKIGITSNPQQRLADHHSQGWSEHKTWHVGPRAIDLERRVMRHFAHPDVSTRNSLKLSMPKGGYTEVRKVDATGMARYVGQLIDETSPPKPKPHKAPKAPKAPKPVWSKPVWSKPAWSPPEMNGIELKHKMQQER